MITHTVAKRVEGTVSVWAVPRASYAITEDKPDLFEYQLRTDKPWQQGAVEVIADEITMTVPAGINLQEKAVETLKEAKEEVMRVATEQLEELQRKIDELMLIEHKQD